MPVYISMQDYWSKYGCILDATSLFGICTNCHIFASSVILKVLVFLITLEPQCMTNSLLVSSNRTCARLATRAEPTHSRSLRNVMNLETPSLLEVIMTFLSDRPPCYPRIRLIRGSFHSMRVAMADNLLPNWCGGNTAQFSY